MVTIACMIYNLAVLAGTAYLVGWRDWSPWWFLGSMLFLASVSTKGAKA